MSETILATGWQVLFPISLHMRNWVYVSVLERDTRNNIICAEGEITDHQECATFHVFPLNCQLIHLVPIVYLFLCSPLKCTLLGK